MILEYIKSLFRTTPLIYEVVECPQMPSAIGMTVVGRPKGTFIIRNDKEFRTINPVSITDIDNGFIVITKHLTIKFDEKGI